MNVSTLLQAFQGGGVAGVLGFVGSYVYQSMQHNSCLANLPPLSYNLDNFAQMAMESIKRQATLCPSPSVVSALGAATVLGLVVTVIGSLVKGNKS